MEGRERSRTPRIEEDAMARAGEELTATLMNRDVVSIEGTVEWTIQPAESGCYVGICDSPGLTLQADTWADMMDEIGNRRGRVIF